VDSHLTFAGLIPTVAEMDIWLKLFPCPESHSHTLEHLNLKCTTFNGTF